MREIPADLPSEIVPLSWLLGVWEGTGVIDYPIGDEKVSREFGQRVSFSHDGLSYLNYSAFTWLVGENGDDEPLTAETGYWRLERQREDGDVGPGILPRRGAAPFADVDAVESLRRPSGGFPLEVSIVHPDGVSELYLGEVNGPRIDIGTDAVMRSAGAKNYSAATRMYGLVDGHLLWAWDIAALGQELRSHASARLAKVD
ncbi:FABP family protein [Paramicrobacterium fandaimingii]|uniref:FABP family protein n=1 Tax=Paramicrobacterium fandaimingii TaxID=2708079 RepID=UPI001422BF1C|nr:FABP family protein [Microbacterium fandaimingii]